MSDVLEDPEFQQWAEHVRAHVMPMIADSVATVSLVPKGEADIKFAVELGLSIMLDKPLILVVQPGTRIPASLARAADEIVEGDPVDVAPRIKEALERLVP